MEMEIVWKDVTPGVKITIQPGCGHHLADPSRFRRVPHMALPRPAEFKEFHKGNVYFWINDSYGTREVGWTIPGVIDLAE